MDISAFFDYPDRQNSGGEDDLVFLPGWNDRDWARLLAHTETRRFSRGEVLIPLGEVDRALYIVAAGTLEVLIPQGAAGALRPYQTVATGFVIGEQAFLDGLPRSAQIRALSDGEVVRLRNDAFEVFAAQNPDLARDFLYDLGRIVSIRLRLAIRFISSWIG